MVCNNKGIVQSFYEKSEKDYGDLANAAVYMIEPSVLNWIVENNLKDFTENSEEKIINCGIDPNLRPQDIKPEEYLRLSKYLIQ